jgi:prepilin-type N-terminal cleavage/methylation domain-containing protein
MRTTGDASIGKLRTAFTLIELLLVLALLVLVAGLTWPALRGPLARQRLVSAAKNVRTELAKGRLAAMRAGELYEGRYTPDGTRLLIRPHHVPDLMEQATANNQDRGSALNMALSEVEAPPTDQLPSLETWLPEGTHFVGGYAEEAVETSLATGASEPFADDESNWSGPIWFYPDGTTSDAQLKLANDNGLELDLSLRGLTGAVDVGAPFKSPEAIP